MFEFFQLTDEGLMNLKRLQKLSVLGADGLKEGHSRALNKLRRSNRQLIILDEYDDEDDERPL